MEVDDDSVFMWGVGHFPEGTLRRTETRLALHFMKITLTPGGE